MHQYPVFSRRSPRSKHGSNGSIANEIVRHPSRDVDEAILLRATGTLSLCSIEVGTMEYDMATETGNVHVFDTWCTLGHDDGGRDFELPGRICDTLCMVSCGAANNTFPALGRVKMRHLIVSASQFEAKYRLLVLAFESNIAFKAIAEVDGVG